MIHNTPGQTPFVICLMITEYIVLIHDFICVYIYVYTQNVKKYQKI